MRMAAVHVWPSCCLRGCVSRRGKPDRRTTTADGTHLWPGLVGGTDGRQAGSSPPTDRTNWRIGVQEGIDRQADDGDVPAEPGCRDGDGEVGGCVRRARGRV